jgi:hypothetical protein
LKGDPLMHGVGGTGLKVLNGGRRSVEDQSRSRASQPSNDGWIEASDGLWSEIARVNALVDKVNAEMNRMVADDSVHALQVIEKNAELRVLHAYYKGLRFAIDRQKEMSRKQFSRSINKKME